MKYINRAIMNDLQDYLKYFPVLLISGVRQVGKYTLALHLKIDNYITLDDINMYEMAKNNPKGFIENLDKIQRLPQLMITIKEFIDKNELQKECGLDNKTFDSYFNVLEHTYQVHKLKPSFKNELKRVIKSPKIYATDTGILSYLLRIVSVSEYEASHYKGDILETFVYNELIKSKTYASNNADLYYYRTSDKKEIDFILEFSSKVVAIEIKSSKSVNKSDLKHIYHLASEIPNEFDKGIIFYNGEQVLKIDDKMYAIPLGFLA